MFINDLDFYISWFWQIPLMVMIQILFLLPIVLIFSTINVFLRDVEYIVNVFLSLLFFLTPIVYPISLVPEKYLSLYNLNPFIIIIENWRFIFFNGTMDYSQIFLFLIVTLLITFLARRFFIMNRMKFGEYL